MFSEIEADEKYDINNLNNKWGDMFDDGGNGKNKSSKKKTAKKKKK